MIRLLDLPGVPEIETRLTLNEMTAQKGTDHELNRWVDELIRETLGVPFQSWSYTSVLYRDDDLDLFEEPIAGWRRRGFDVLGEDGARLRCLKHLDWALKVVAAGAGDLSTLQIEANLWKAGKAARDAANQNHIIQNRKFLELGRKRRRSA